MRYNVAAVLATAFVSAAAQGATPNMKEGLWEITTKMEMPGMPAGMPPQTIKQCITKKDLDNPQRMAPTGQKDDRCQSSDYKLQGNTASWTWTCKGDDEMRGSGTMTFSGNSYTGTTKISMKQGGQMHNMTMQYTGRHLGECK